MLNSRKSGIILHPTSLPGKYGIGDLGGSAYEFVDFLEKAGQQLWQILPLGPVTKGGCPYQSFSAFAGNVQLISLESLFDMSLLQKKDLVTKKRFDDSKVNFRQVVSFKNELIGKALLTFLKEGGNTDKDYLRFVKGNQDWLNDYSTFMSIHEEQADKNWWEWPDGLKNRKKAAVRKVQSEKKSRILFHNFSQYIFHKQWMALKGYANQKSVQIVGDLPIYVSGHSADAWSNPKIFELDKSLKPAYVAGVPPDAFSDTGQYWGNPVYNWKQIKKARFSWWIKRMKANLSMYDYIRVDHFRGFESFWKIPAEEVTAQNGTWKKAPGWSLFRQFRKKIDKNLPIIAEDLGEITSEVTWLRDHFSLPGMKVLQFAFDFDAENPYLLHNHSNNSVVYTGTHDNNTIIGWYESLSKKAKKLVNSYLLDTSEINWSAIRYAWASPCAFSFTTLQDVIGLGEDARFNDPSKRSGNWDWRYTREQLTETHAIKLKALTAQYDRLRTNG